MKRLFLFLITGILLSLLILFSCTTETEPEIYPLNTFSSPLLGGTTTPAQGDYEEGEVVEITAIPNEHWIFTEWDGSIKGTENPIMVTMDSHKNVVARFTYTIHTFEECGDMLNDYEGNEYKTVQIGEQCWMAENLKKIHHDLGVLQNNSENDQWSGSGWAYYENDSTYNHIYGKLYSWSAAITPGLCPGGWHVPGDDEWKELERFLGMKEEEIDERFFRGEEDNIGGKLKAVGTQFWASPNSNATNESGFTALPGGNAGGTRNFCCLGVGASWWTSTERAPGATAWGRGLGSSNQGIYRFSGYGIGRGHSVRCIMD